MRNIPLFKVKMPKNMGQILDPILQSGYISQGPKAQEFEEKFQAWLENPNTALVNSGTSALTIAMKLAGIGPGTEVITSPMSCLATNEPILTLGATPVWCDVNPSTGNIDPSKIEALITSKTRAILFVDWAGIPCDLAEIGRIASNYGLKTIEDAAHALGALYLGHKVGSLHFDYTCFSFQAIKHLTTVDGGALACRTKADYERAVLLRWFGLSRNHNMKSPVNWEGDVVEPGFKAHMNDVNAAIGLEQLKTIDEVIEQHRQNGWSLLTSLDGLQGVTPLYIPPYTKEPSFWIFTIKLRDSTHRAMVSKGLTEAGIGNSIVHTRNDIYSLFAPFKRPLPGVDDFGSRMLNIPCGWWVTQKDIAYITKTLENLQ